VPLGIRLPDEVASPAVLERPNRRSRTVSTLYAKLTHLPSFVYEPDLPSYRVDDARNASTMVKKVNPIATLIFNSAEWNDPVLRVFLLKNQPARRRGNDDVRIGGMLEEHTRGVAHLHPLLNGRERDLVRRARSKRDFVGSGMKGEGPV
jgi:hypothetical protein